MSWPHCTINEGDPYVAVVCVCVRMRVCVWNIWCYASSTSGYAGMPTHGPQSTEHESAKLTPAQILITW